MKLVTPWEFVFPGLTVFAYVATAINGWHAVKVGKPFFRKRPFLQSVFRVKC